MAGETKETQAFVLGAQRSWAGLGALGISRAAKSIVQEPREGRPWRRAVGESRFVQLGMSSGP